jgi:hypothetical protein
VVGSTSLLRAPASCVLPSLRDQCFSMKPELFQVCFASDNSPFPFSPPPATHLNLTESMKYALLSVLLLTTLAAPAQENPDPPRFQKAPAKRNFFSMTNNFLLASSAATLAMDGVSTQRLVSFPIQGKVYNAEGNPILRLSSSRTWTAVYFGASFAAVSGGTYYFHRRANHPHAKKFWRVAESTLPIAISILETKVFVENMRAINRAACVTHHPVVQSNAPNPCL